MRKTSGKGVVDFNEKISVLCLLLGVPIIESSKKINLCRKFEETVPANVRSHLAATDLANAMKDWFPGRAKVSDPLGTPGKAFRESVCYVLRLNSCVGDLDEVFRTGTVDAFIDLIPNPSVEIESLKKSPKRRDDLSTIITSHHYMDLNVRSGVDAGLIDQKLCYLMPSSPRAWNNIATTTSYGQFHQCREAVDRLIKSDAWKEFCSLQPCAVVALGAGSAAKDILFLQSLAVHVPSEAPPLTYWLVDYSKAMLSDTDVRIRKLAGQSDWIKRFSDSPRLWESDFLRLEHGVINRRRGSPVCWHILGGTLGNLNELEFLKSISYRAEKNDLLLIGIDTIDPDISGEQREQFRNELIKKYSGNEVKELVRGSLTFAWADLRQTRDIDSAVRELAVDVIEGRRGGYSSLDNSITVRIFSRWNGKEVVLAASTRYNESTFIKFVEEFDFKFVPNLSASSLANPLYKILSFVRV